MGGVSFASLWPTVLAVGAALGVLLLEGSAQRRNASVRPARLAAGSTMLAVIALLVAAGVAADALAAGGVPRASGGVDAIFVLDAYAAWATVALATLVAALVLGTVNYQQKRALPATDMVSLSLMATAGAFVWVGSRDLVLTLFAWELATLPIALMSASDPARPLSARSGFRAVIHGSVASAVAWFGLACLYAAIGATDYAAISEAWPSSGFLARLGCGLVLAGWLSRLAVVPFHLAQVGAQQGAPTSVAAYASAVQPLAGFVALLRFSEAISLPDDAPFREGLWLIAAATITVGHTLAFLQSRIKPMLAYTGIAQAGWLLAAVVSRSAESSTAMCFAALAFAWMNAGLFGVLVTLAEREGETDHVDRFIGFATFRPLLAGLLAIFCLSQAAVPGTVGFIARFQLVRSLFENGDAWIAVVGVLASVLGFVGFARIPLSMWGPIGDRPGPLPPVRTGEGILLAVAAAVVLIAGIAPTGLGDWVGTGIDPWSWVERAVTSLR